MIVIAGASEAIQRNTLACFVTPPLAMTMKFPAKSSSAKASA